MHCATSDAAVRDVTPLPKRVADIRRRLPAVDIGRGPTAGVCADRRRAAPAASTVVT